MTYLTLTFNHEAETFKGIRDFEKILSQAIYSESTINKWKDKYSAKDEQISYVSSVNIYRHDNVKLSTKSKPILSFPISRSEELRLLNFVSNN